MNCKTRFAPSPTGNPHIWHLRTAIYAWLTAKHNNWVFYLRLEDTDQARFVPGTADILIKAIKWIGIDPDEGFLWEDIPEKWEFWPYVQSKRKDLYKKYAEELIKKWAAFYCFCPKEKHNDDEIFEVKDNHDYKCRNLTEDEIKNKLNNWESYVIKHKIPLNETIITQDLIRWTQKILTNTLDDSILLKSDWNATYHLAHLVDDYLMQTSHVIRSEEWLPSLAKHILLFKQMWWNPPIFAHPSLIVIIDKETWNKRKFAKRKWDPTVFDLIKIGYLPETLFNFIVFLWWNPGKWETKEIYSKEELVQIFKLEDCNKSWALFDINKLNWMNSEYIKKSETIYIYDKLEEYLKEYDPPFYNNIFSKFPKEYNLKIIKELQTKLIKFEDFKLLTTFFYNEPEIKTNLLINEKMWINNLEIVKKSLELALEILNSNNFDNLDDIKNKFIEKIKLTEMKNGQVLWPVRVSLSGEEFSPWAFELIYILWKEKSIVRINKFLDNIE